MLTSRGYIVFFLGFVLACLSFSLAYAKDSIPSPLRVCADPDNLPFSNEDPERKGLYLDIAELIATKLGVQTEVFWWRTHSGKRAIRETLLKGRCDIQLGVPFEPGFMARRVALTKPFLKLHYAILGPPGMRLTKLADLHGKKVGVLHNRPPQNVIAQHDQITAQTYVKHQDVVIALAEGEIDAAFLWGPVAGYYNKYQWHSQFEMIRTDGPQLGWPVAIGVKGSETGLRHRQFLDSQTQFLLSSLESAIDQLQDEIASLKAKYGFSNSEPIFLDWLPVRLVADTKPPANSNAAQEQPQSDPVDQKTKDTVRGGKLFNGVYGCSHCHGPDGIIAQKNQDLRRLRKRYGEKFDEVFRTTVDNGRISKGMPAWKGKIKDEDIEKIRLYLVSIQVD